MYPDSVTRKPASVGHRPQALFCATLGAIAGAALTVGVAVGALAAAVGAPSTVPVGPAPAAPPSAPATAPPVGAEAGAGLAVGAASAATGAVPVGPNGAVCAWADATAGTSRPVRIAASLRGSARGIAQWDAGGNGRSEASTGRGADIAASTGKRAPAAPAGWFTAAREQRSRLVDLSSANAQSPARVPSAQRRTSPGRAGLLGPAACGCAFRGTMGLPSPAIPARAL